MGQGMEEVKGAEDPWTVASDPQDGGEKWCGGILEVKCVGEMDTDGQMERR